jgi:hypothetical protein
VCDPLNVQFSEKMSRVRKVPTKAAYPRGALNCCYEHCDGRGEASRFLHWMILKNLKRLRQRERGAQNRRHLYSYVFYTKVNVNNDNHYHYLQHKKVQKVCCYYIAIINVRVPPTLFLVVQH